jgi:hypothetical protein
MLGVIVGAAPMKFCCRFSSRFSSRSNRPLRRGGQAKKQLSVY